MGFGAVILPCRSRLPHDNRQNNSSVPVRSRIIPRNLLPLLTLTLTGCPSPATTPSARVTPLPPGDRMAAALPHVRAAASRHGVDAALIMAVIKVESTFRPRAGSGAGARGLMQLMPRTAAGLARRLGYEDHDIYDPAFNVDAGTAYLKMMLLKFDGRLELALAAYNSGPGRVAGWQKRGAPLPGYSRRYVADVLAARTQMRAYLKSGQDPGQQEDTLDRGALRGLIKDRNQRYGQRPDEAL